MNVLFIAVDDLRPELGCYGHKQILSPNIDRLAREGLLFERTYCQQAVCGATRASLLCGARPDTNGVHGNSIPLRQAMPDVVTLPEHFKLNGYETLSIGKIYHHPNDDEQGWTAPPYRAGTFAEGPWKGRGYLTEEAIAQMEKYNKANPRMQGRGPAFEAADVPDNAYPDGNNVEYAIRQLRRLKDKPFFMAMGFYKPHLPFNAEILGPVPAPGYSPGRQSVRPEGRAELRDDQLGRVAQLLRHPQAGPVPGRAGASTDPRLLRLRVVHRRDDRPAARRARREARPARQHRNHPLGRPRVEARRARRLVQAHQLRARHARADDPQRPRHENGGTAHAGPDRIRRYLSDPVRSVRPVAAVSIRPCAKRAACRCRIISRASAPCLW